MLDEDEDEMLYSDQELADMEGYQPEDGGLGRSGHPLPLRFTSVIFFEGGRGGGSGAVMSGSRRASIYSLSRIACIVGFSAGRASPAAAAPGSILGLFSMRDGLRVLLPTSFLDR